MDGVNSMELWYMPNGKLTEYEEVWLAIAATAVLGVVSYMLYEIVVLAVGILK